MKEVSKLLYAWIHLEKVHNLLCSKNGGVTAVPDLHSQLDSWQQTGVPEQYGESQLSLTSTPPWQQTGVTEQDAGVTVSCP